MPAGEACVDGGHLDISALHCGSAAYQLGFDPAAATRLADGALNQLREAEERLAASEAQLREAEARMEDLQRALPAQAVVDARQRATEAAAAAAEAVAVAAVGWGCTPPWTTAWACPPVRRAHLSTRPW